MPCRSMSSSLLIGVYTNPPEPHDINDRHRSPCELIACIVARWQSLLARVPSGTAACTAPLPRRHGTRVLYGSQARTILRVRCLNRAVSDRSYLTYGTMNSNPTTSNFVSKAQSAGFSSTVHERYDDRVWSKHQEAVALAPSDDRYDPDLHYPWLLILSLTPPN